MTCGIYLFDRRNKLLIQHPTKFRDTVWSIPKGRMDEGETDYFEVAKRELFEETGIELDKYTIIYKEEFYKIKQGMSERYLKSYFIQVKENLSRFKCHCDSMVYRNGEASFPEVDAWKWVTIDDAIEIMSSDSKTDFQMHNLYRCKEILEIE